MSARVFAIALALSAMSAAALAAGNDPPAKKLFSEVTVPSPGTPRVIGSYAKGCLAGADALPVTGPHWQVMRLSRNRNWGDPELISYIEKFSQDAAKDGWNGLLIGDMAQPRGGPMITGHASHQIGLDVDIWYVEMPDHTLTAEERETMQAESLVMKGKLEVDPNRWSSRDTQLLKRAASFPDVARIFVSPAIKKEACNTAGSDRGWLRKLRPWYGHADHFHVRLRCPSGQRGCIAQAPPPRGDGCGSDLAWWFRPPPPPKPHKGPYRPPRQLTLADLPKACSTVLTADPGGLSDTNLVVQTPLPHLRPSTN